MQAVKFAVVSVFLAVSLQAARLRHVADAPGSVNALRADSAGNLYVAGHLSSGEVYLAKLTAGGQEAYRIVLGGSVNDGANALAVNGSGTACVAGTASSHDFPTTPGAVQRVFLAGTQQSYVACAAADGTLRYITFLGEGADSSVSAIAVNSAGEAIVTGRTTHAGFPTTPGAPVTSELANTGYTVKLDTNGAALLASMVGLGAGPVAVDAEDNIYVAGLAWSDEALPVSPGGLQSSHGQRVCGGSGLLNFSCTYGYVTKLNPQANAIVYSTFLTGSYGSLIASLEVGADGSATVAGTTRSDDFPTTPGALLEHYIAAEPEPPPPVIDPHGTVVVPPQTGFVAKLNATGTGLVFGTYFGGTGTDDLFAMTVRPDAIYVAGEGRSSDVPGLSQPLRCVPLSYVARLAPDGSSVLDASAVPNGGASELVFAGDTGPLAGKDNGVSQLELDGVPEHLACVTDAANLRPTTTVAPGELLSLFGRDLAQEALIGEATDGKLPLSLGGLRVTFNGVPAPLLYVSGEQANVQVPFEIAGSGKVTMSIDSVMPAPGRDYADTPVVLGVAPSRPAFFVAPEFEAVCNGVIARGTMVSAVALNEDGTLNTCANPAKGGSEVSVFLEGAGVKEGVSTTGAVAGSPEVMVNVAFGGTPTSGLAVLDATTIPGSIASVWRVRLRLPVTQRYVGFTTSVDGVSDKQGTMVIWVR